MKVCFYILLYFFTFTYLNAQEGNRTKNTTRTPDFLKENLISHKVSGVFGIKDFIGISTSAEYERKIIDKPIAWFGSLTIGSIDNYPIDETQEYDKDEVKVSFLHLGGGFHYYPLDYEAVFKPYIGLGGLIGGNRHSREYIEDEINYITEIKTGFDIGLYGILGVRWGKGLIRCGLEYRAGYFHTKIFDDQISTDRHEISFSFSFQF